MSDSGLGFDAGQDYSKRMPSPQYITQMQQLEKQNRQFTKTIETAADINRRIVELLDKTEKAVKEANELTKLQRPRGKIYPIDLDMPSGANSRLVHIDFITGTKDTVNLPAGTNLNYPGDKLYYLEIKNVSGGANIAYSTNEAKGSMIGATVLAGGETDKLGPFLFPTFETINVSLQSAAVSGATVRIRGLA